MGNARNLFAERSAAGRGRPRAVEKMNPFGVDFRPGLTGEIDRCRRKIIDGSKLIGATVFLLPMMRALPG
jgi:hypothetical protein